MGRPKKVTVTENESVATAKRPNAYIPQQGTKATLTLADFEDGQLFGELRRRGYTGELRYTKVVTV